MPASLLRRAPIAAGLAACSALLIVGCGAKSDVTATSPTTASPATSAPAGSASKDGATSGTTPGKNAAAGGECPEATVITVHTSDGDKTLTAKAAKASITLNSSMQIGIGNFDVPDDQITSIKAPTLTADQQYVDVYVTATQGKTLEPGTYTSVNDELAPLQLNTSEAYDASGRLYFSGFSKVKENVKISTLDKAKKKVCGTITTELFDGPFSADVIAWSE